MRTLKGLMLALIATSTLAGCGESADGGGTSTSGGVCFGSGSQWNCQGRICSVSGAGAVRGVVCPDGQYCPFPTTSSISGSPVCARRS